MKRLMVILAIATLLAIPVGLYAQVEAGAGSIKIGAHIDTTYRYSAEDNNDPDVDEVYGAGYDTFNAENVILGLSGKVGDKVLWKITEAFDLNTGGVATLLDANVEWKIIDQLGLIVGRQLVPTALANVPHMMKVHYLANVPLMISGGYNNLGWLLPLPTYQTGLGIDVNFSGLNLNYTIYNGELAGVAPAGGNDLLTENDKSKGGNIAVGYSGELGPGKLAARAYYFSEESDTNFTPEPDSSHIAGWGLGALYNADNFFVGAEYVNKSIDFEKTIDDLNYDQYGWYGLIGGRFSSIEVLLRYDFIDYTSLNDDDINGVEDVDTEQWWNFGVNYLINDNTTIGVGYVWKIPEEPDGIDYPNVDEFVINVELDIL